MTANSEEKQNSNENIWGKVLKFLLYGIILSVVGLLSQFLTKYLRHEPFPIHEGAIYFVVFFFLGAYMIMLISEKYENRLLKALSPRWRKVTATLRFWYYSFIAWFVLIVVRGAFLQQVLQIDSSFLDMILVYLIYALLFSLSIYSLAAYIPSGQYLVSTQIKIEDKKKVADALTALTPILGFPLILATYLALSLVNIQVEPYWINYLLFIFIYFIVFFLFVDFPYSASIMDKKKKELENLEKERVTLLENLQKVGDDKTKTLLRKIAFESEIARIDRKKQEIKSQSVHPYKLIIPFASFLLGIFGVLFIDFIKNILQLV